MYGFRHIPAVDLSGSKSIGHGINLGRDNYLTLNKRIAYLERNVVAFAFAVESTLTGPIQRLLWYCLWNGSANGDDRSVRQDWCGVTFQCIHPLRAKNNVGSTVQVS